MAQTPSIWEAAKARLSVGQIVQCTVNSHHPFGMLVSLCLDPADGEVEGVIERIGMGYSGYDAPADYPPVGSQVATWVVDFRDDSQQVDVALLPKAQPDGSIWVNVRFTVHPQHGASSFGATFVNWAVKHGYQIVRLEEERRQVNPEVISDVTFAACYLHLTVKVHLSKIK